MSIDQNTNTSHAELRLTTFASYERVKHPDFLNGNGGCFCLVTNVSGHKGIFDFKERKMAVPCNSENVDIRPLGSSFVRPGTVLWKIQIKSGTTLIYLSDKNGNALAAHMPSDHDILTAIGKNIYLLQKGSSYFVAGPTASVEIPIGKSADLINVVHEADTSVVVLEFSIPGDTTTLKYRVDSVTGVFAKAA